MPSPPIPQHSEGSRAAGVPDAAIIVDLSPIAHVPNALKSARDGISSRQRKVNSNAKRDFVCLAALFVLAVTIFEIFAKFFHGCAWLLGAYLVALSWIGFIALRARFTMSEAIAEDYRGVVEILRVQRAWWSVGLTARVDRNTCKASIWTLLPPRLREDDHRLDPVAPRVE